MTCLKSSLSAAEARPNNVACWLTLDPRAVKGGECAIGLSRSQSTAKAAVFVCVFPESWPGIRAFAEAEGLTVQDLGVYALILALAHYGRYPAVNGRYPAVKGAGGTRLTVSALWLACRDRHLVIMRTRVGRSNTMA